MARLFGTDGVRGVANTELTPETAFSLGSALTRYLVGRNLKTPEILIGMDTRRSGQMLESALVTGILSSGGNAHIAGVIPTPAVAFLTKKYDMCAGIVISASHNPFLDNGIKIFDKSGHKMDDAVEDAIESLSNVIKNEQNTANRPVGGNIGRKYDAHNALRDYVNHIKLHMGAGDVFCGIRAVLDCANGAMYKAAPDVFKELGADVNVMANEPNGENINLRCGSTHIAQLASFVPQSGYDVGFAFDGDGDRCLAVDERGVVVDGDQIMSMLALHYKSTGMLKKDTVVATVMSNLGFGKMCRDNGISLKQTDVGDKYVLKCMLENGYMLGGEQSGHIINLNYGTTGDGLSTACAIVQVMKETGKKLSELSAVMEKYPQVLRNARVSNERKSGYLSSSEIMNAITELEDRMKDNGRVLIRPSGTEPLIRVMIEGRDIGEITRDAEQLAALIEDVLS